MVVFQTAPLQRLPNGTRVSRQRELASTSSKSFSNFFAYLFSVVRLKSADKQEMQPETHVLGRLVAGACLSSQGKVIVCRGKFASPSE